MLLRNPFSAIYPMFSIEQTDVKNSIDAFLSMLIGSNKSNCIADDEFGFSLEDFRYEAFSTERAKFLETKSLPKDPTENTMLRDIYSPLYAKRLVGNSKNTDTFARELKTNIERYEKRLKDVSVIMDFQMHGKIIHITVNGNINDQTNAFYHYEKNVEVW